MNAIAPIRVLILDECTASAELLANVLRSVDCDVVVAEDGSAGAMLASRYKPNILFISLDLETSNPFELVQDMLLDTVLANSTFIAMKSGGEQTLDPIETGFAYCVTKPLNADGIKRIITTVIPRSDEDGRL